MAEPYQHLKVLDIYLDSENPRHEPIIDENKIIEYLVSREKVYNLAKDIAQVGAVSPIELVGVMKNKNGHYIALEGNRRICALKLLNDPERAPKGKSTLFKKLQSTSSSIPDGIMTVVFNNRDEADLWLERRHQGELGGVGPKKWDATQKTRQNRKKDKTTKDQNILAQSLLDYATKYNIIGEYPRRVLTTATRYLSNPDFRAAIGIISRRSDSDVVINVTHEDFEIFLKRFCADLIEGKKVSSRSNLPDRTKYLEGLQNEGITPYTKVSSRVLSERKKDLQTRIDGSQQRTTVSPNVANSTTAQSELSGQNIGGSLNNTSQSNNLSSKPTGTTKDPDKRKYILPEGFKIGTQNKIIRRTAQEMRQIVVEDQPLAVALLTRAFLEACYFQFVEGVTGQYPASKQTHAVISDVCKLLETEINQKVKNGELKKSHKNALSSLRKLGSNQHSPLSPQTLGGFAHIGAYPDHTTLKREFDNIAAVIEYILPEI